MAQALPILVVEDDPNLREAVCDTLELAGQAVVSAPGGEEALRLLDAQSVALVVSDVRMMPMDGITLLKEIRNRYAASAGGADDGLCRRRSGGRGDALRRLRFPAQAVRAQGLARTRGALRCRKRWTTIGVVASDPASRNLFALATRVAQTDTTVLLTGESGVGKEVVARYIHNHSARKCRPFVAINCAAIPDSLLEATLFGYEKGAFTGAQQAQAGKFEQAQNGTLLLDEVTEMPLGCRPSCCAFCRSARSSGSAARSRCRSISASSPPPTATWPRPWRKGRLREDVYYRLNVFPLLIPALRQRADDIVPLAQHFLAEHGGRAGRPGLRLSPSAEDALRRHPWPGNVRELENVMQRAVIFAAGDVVEADALHLSVLVPGASKPASGRSARCRRTPLSDGTVKRRTTCVIWSASTSWKRWRRWRVAQTGRRTARDVGTNLASQAQTVPRSRFVQRVNVESECVSLGWRGSCRD
jgi:two-component system response regulator FlrC